MKEMMIATAAFIRGEAATANKKKGHMSWKPQDQSKKHTDKRPDFRGHSKDGRGANRFTPLTRTPKEILMAEANKFQPPPPMVTPVEKRNGSKFCDFHNDKGHNTDECMQLKKQIEDHGTEGPLVIEVEVGGHTIHRMYIDGSSSMEILYEHCFNRIWPDIKRQMVPATTSLTGFSGETTWPLGQLKLLVTIGDATHSTKAWMNFMIVKSLSPYNGIIGRLGLKAIQAVPSTVHGMLKFSTEEGIVTIRSSLLIPAECASVDTSSVTPEEKKARPTNLTVPLYPNFPNQEVVVGGSLSDKGRTELCSHLKKNLDIFAWQPSDITGVPRSVAEHRLNDCYPLSEIDWKVESLCGYPFKCFLDAYKGYHQIQMAAADEEKIAFHTGHGVYCYTKMPFGLKNAGATYQRLMDKAFENQMGRNIEVYVDDLVVKSHTEAEMVRDIEETFQTLRKINMKLNPKKCSFGLAKGIFLGYVITPEGIKPCPDKMTVVQQLPSPQTIKETLKKCIKKSDFRWTTEAEQAFQQLKQHLSALPLLAAPKPREELIMYLSATHGAISTVLMTERGTAQMPVYFISRALQGPELNYSPMKKLVLSLVFAAKRLQRYFQAHPITGQILADFLNEMPSNASQGVSVAETQEEPWTLFTDGSLCVDGSGAGLILTNPDGVEFTYALRFQFAASNNEAEYEALIADLRIATQTRVKNIQANVDSKLVANQVLGAYVAKEDNMIKYLEITNGLVSGFKTFSISQVPRSRNKKVDALSKLASTSFAHLSKQVLVEVLETKSIIGKEVTAVIEEEGPTWMTELVNSLKEGILPGDEKEARKLRLKARRYELMEGVLYKQSFVTPWLRCVGPLQAEYVMKEIHEGSCSMHAGPWSVVAKAIRLGYFWPTMHKDAQDMIRKCSDCQLHRPITRHPQQPRTPITAPWPFYKWGIDIAGPFPEGPGKVKFLIVAIDYFTKWI
nr:reverse transcriptase domain-containing protein [Tanacetum cinerariifolium]